MPQTPCFILRLLLVSICVSSVTILFAQSDQRQNIFSSNKNFNTAAPVKKIYDEDAKSWYAVYNSDNILHVYIAVTDQAQQRKIVMNGIELWIDTKGKKNKKTGIQYPFNEMDNKQGPAQGPPGMGRPGAFDERLLDTNNIARLEKAIAQHREMKLTGFNEELNGVQNIDHPSGIHVSLYFIKDTLVYDAQLPLNTLPETPAVNSRIAIGIIEKGMQAPSFGGDGMAPPDGGPGGDGMMPPPGGGGPPPGGPEAMALFEDNIIWYKLLLQPGIVAL